MSRAEISGTLLHHYLSIPIRYVCK